MNCCEIVYNNNNNNNNNNNINTNGFVTMLIALVVIGN